MLPKILGKIRERLEEVLATALWALLAIPTWGIALRWAQEEKTAPEARLLVLLLALSIYLSLLFVAGRVREKRTKLDYRRNMYWLRSDSRPFCPVCYDDKKKKVRPHSCDFGEGKNGYRCAVCGYQYVATGGGDFHVSDRFKKT
jgi:rubredoxin